MSVFVHKTVDPPAWCSLTHEQWRERWRSVIRTAASAGRDTDLGWTQDAGWGWLRWEAISYYDALALAEGNAGVVFVRQVAVFDPQPALNDGMVQPRSNFAWWRWRRDGCSLSEKSERVSRRGEGTKLVLSGVVAPVLELESHLPWLGSRSLALEVSSLAHRLLWNAVGVADLARNVPEAEATFYTARIWPHELVEATRSAREWAAIQSDRQSVREAKTGAVHRESVDHALQQLRGHATARDTADGTSDDSVVRSGEGSDAGAVGDTGMVRDLREFRQVSVPRQGPYEADSFYCPRHSSIEEIG